MKFGTVVVAFLAAGLLDRAISPTNSRAAAARGVSAYARGEMTEAEAAFRTATELRPSAETAFDLGTTQIAAGNVTEGAASLEQAVNDPALRRDALFNRGNGALGAKAWDHAIRDFEEVLRMTPDYVAAKRNLEIALRRREESQQQTGQENQQQQQQSQNEDPRSQQQKDSDEQGSAEALLRSVEQQEREELARMRRARGGSPRVGW